MLSVSSLWCPWDAGEIMRRPEIETLLVTKGNRTEVTKKVLTWLTEAVN